MKRLPSWIVLLCCEAVIILIMLSFGFKFTYAPTLDNSWEAISAVASWAGVITSSVAIFVAIQVPKKIAEQQNKIALFDKRYEAMKEIETVNSFCGFLKSMKTENIRIFLNII